MRALETSLRGEHPRLNSQVSRQNFLLLALLRGLKLLFFNVATQEKPMTTQRYTNGRKARAPLAMAVAFALLSAPAAHAFDFEKGELTGSLDTTVTVGHSWRIEDIDQDLIGISNVNPLIGGANQGINAPFNTLGTFPGSAVQLAAPGRFSVNRDDGNVLYGKGDPISQAFKITSELSLKYKNFGAFARASYFYDFENADRKDLTKLAREKVGEDFRLLDAFIYADFDLGEHKLNARLGRQVISWGESTFIQGGINVINPIDVSKLRIAGAELKDAFLPVDSVWASYAITDNLSIEGTYLFEFEQTEADPAGTYFSSNDFATTGGTYVMLGFGAASQPVLNPERYGATCAPGGSVANSDRFASLAGTYGAATATAILTGACRNAVPRGPDRKTSDDGQGGIAVRYFSEALNQTEFGFYFMNYHSRLPLLSGFAVNVPGFIAGGGVSAANNSSFFVEYPEDIQMYGMSWNTTLPAGVAFQGEVSYRPNQPLQVDDVELLFASLSSLNPVLQASGAPIASRFFSQLGSTFTSGQEVRGWREKEVTQLQMTFTKALSQTLGADQIAMVAEVGATQVWDLEDASVLRYEGEGTDTGGGRSLSNDLLAAITAYNTTPSAATAGALAAALANPANAGALRNPSTTVDGFPTAFSWGYRLAARADYNSFMGTPITLSPRIAFNHDVNGISPGPGGNFLEGRKSFTIGVEANYLNKWVFDLSFTNFTGAGGLNQIHDRDFGSFSVKYSF
jgi:Protein of unknown function (DUF1302)